MEEDRQGDQQRDQRQAVANHHQVEVSQGCLQGETQSVSPSPSHPPPHTLPLTLCCPLLLGLTECWELWVALQMVKLVQVRLLSG